MRDPDDRSHEETPSRADAGASESLRLAPVVSPDVYRALLDSMTEGVSLATEDGTIVYTNPAEDRMFGYAPGELVGQHVSVQNAYPPDENARIVDEIIAELKRSGAWRGEWLNRRKDGSVFVTRSRITAVEIEGRRHWLCVQEDVTDEKAANAALRDSEARLEIATRAAEIGIWDWDLLTNRMTYSPRAKAICGFPLDRDVTFEDARAVVHPEDHPFTSAQARRALDPAIRDRSPYEYRIVRPDGTVRWVLAHGEAMFSEVDGVERAVRYVGTIQDITERRRLEDAERAAAQRLRLAADAGRMAVWEVDIVNDTVFGSPELNRLLGFPEDATPTLDELRTGYAPGERERLQAIRQEVLARGDRFMEAEFRYRWPDGTPRWLLLRCEFLLDGQGSPVRAVGVLADVTERKAAEEALRLRAEEFRALADNIASLCWMAEADGRIFWFNRRWYEYTGTRPDSQEGWGWTSVHDPEQLPAVLARWKHSIKTGEPFEMTFPLRGADGVFRPFLTRVVPIRDEGGTIVRWFGTNVDISGQVETERLLERRVAERTAELKRALERLQEEAAQRERTEEALRQAQKMEAMGQLTGGISHDFNNLLQAIRGNLDLIRRRPDDVERVRRWAENAAQAADRGARLTGQLLAFSRLQRLQLRPVIAADLVAGMRDLLTRTLGPMVRITLDLDRRRIPVLADPTQLEMAVLNLAINARDAMPEGGSLTITTALRRISGDAELPPGEYIELSVTDTGIGMPAEVAARAFDPFFTTKGAGKGTGLGLSQVYGITRQAGGTARIDSAPGRGTTVTLLLKRTRATIADCPPADAIRDEAAVPGATVLVVDDDPDVRQFLVESLATLGYRALEAADGRAGLEILRQSRPDLLLLDFAMPDMNGAEMARAAKALRPELPIVFTSGYADTAAIDAVGGAPAVILRKPFRVEELQALLAGLLTGP